MTDSQQYLDKKRFYDKLLTIYGRKAVLEAMQDESLEIYKLHLADTNKSGGIVAEIIQLAEQRGIEIDWHDRKSLSRISKNSKQDQGVAADIEIKGHQPLAEFLTSMKNRPFTLIALNNITNPQNLGMIIRSVCAGNVDGILLPSRGCASLSPLVIKASAGTLFRATLLRCETLLEGLKDLKKAGAEVCSLSSHASESLFNYQPATSVVYVLGNETEGVSKEIELQADTQLAIPMNNGVESLNVAITAALIAFNNTSSAP